MPSPIANKILYRITGDDEANYWLGVAKTFIRRKDEHQAAEDWELDRAGLVRRLKTELSGQFEDANDEHWCEVADSLFSSAIRT